MTLSTAGLDGGPEYPPGNGETGRQAQQRDRMSDETGSPRPWFSVPYTAGYAFAWLME
ncbi:hypothetical protein [Verrucosispora sp. WMMD573]|uniref:hypothetical protein n=1 Tax=Verrucosispora sp. WMMD573 TaxID=3015149 RepID=UPI00248D32EF|nr:hypothetical protein [Verrucosispora sp. WMMD573]WBB55608.1 hypothetical protein O7601_05745 [Verrucosispora sp. WMMD573]